MPQRRKPRNRNRGETPTTDETSQPEDNSRRNFLIRGGSTVAAVSGITYLLSTQKEGWPFITHKADFRDELDADQAMEFYPQLGAAAEFKNPQSDLDGLINTMNQGIRSTMHQRGYTQDEYKVRQFSVFVGLPLSREISKSSLRYVDEAINLLHTSIRGLLDLEVSVIPVKSNGKYQNLKKGNLFVADGFHHVLNFDIYTNDGTVISAGAFKTQNGLGGRTVIKYDNQTKKPIIKNIIVAASSYLLVSVFSEMILYLLEEYDRKNTVKLLNAGYNPYHAGETFQEALSTELARKLGRKLGINDIDKLVDGILDTLSIGNEADKYRFVKSHSVPWVQKNGFQNAYDLWMQSPVKFMETIGVPPEEKPPAEYLDRSKSLIME